MSDRTPSLEEQQVKVELIFKPLPPGKILRVEESRLISAYIGEILKEIEEEEKLIMAEQMKENP